MKRPPRTEDLGIDLISRKETELFKWFLLCLLFGKPIQREIAERAYHELVHQGLVSPDAILRAGWDELVHVLDEAHYVRYDFSTATKLLEISEEVKTRYGSITKLVNGARTSAELSARLQTLKHVGPVTARIFLRGVRPIFYGDRATQSAGSAGKGMQTQLGCPELKPMADFEEIEHTADRAFRARGTTLPKLFENAARAIASPQRLEPTEETLTIRDVEVEGVDRETLLVNWLNEILYLEQTRGEVYDEFQVTEITDTRLRAKLYGRSSPSAVSHIKAVTFHNLEVRQTAQGFEATIVVDV